MAEIELRLPKYHKSQSEIANNAARFNTANTGRRFGKTTMALRLIAETALDGKPSAFYSPSYKTLSEVWKHFKSTFAPITRNKSEQIKQIVLINGATIDFWSLDDPNASRGRKYARVVIDEAAFIKHLQEAWSQTIMPTLADYSGDAYLFSTPKGKSSHWYKMCNTDNPNWKHFHYTIYDNPFIKREEIELLKANTDSLTWLQEYLAEFIELAGNPFFTEFSEEKHVVQSIDIDMGYPLLLSFDFNYNPTTMIASQLTHKGLNFIKEHSVDGGTRKLLETLEYYRQLTNLVITGDNSGHSNKSSSDYTDFQLIEQFFGRPVDKITKKANSLHSHSRTICNSILWNWPVRYSKEGCPDLIAETQKAKATKDGKLLKDDKENRMDKVDAKRYACNYYAATVQDIIDIKRQYFESSN